MTGGSSGGSNFDVTVTDGVSVPSGNAARALRTLKSHIDRETKSLTSMQAAMKRLQSGSSVDVATFRRLDAQIRTSQDAIARAETQFQSLGGEMALTSANAAGVGAAMGPLGAIVSAGSAAFLSFAAAVIGAAGALAHFALSSSDARRAEMLQLEGLTTLRNYYGVAAGSATDLMNAIDRVSDSSALSRTELSGMAQSLYRVGLRGGNLEDALEGLSIAQSVQGDRGAQRFRALAVSIARTGGSVRRLTDDYRTRLGGIATRQALGLGRQMERLRESVSRIFADVRIDGFLNGLHSVINLFSQSTVTGRALHQLAGVIFSPMFDSVGDGAPIVVTFLQRVAIGIQRITIYALQAAVMLHHMQQSFENAQGVKALHNLGAAFGELDAALHLSDRGLATIEATLRTLFPTLSSTVDLVRTLASLFGRSGEPLGVALANGLARGIQSGAETVRSAARALGDEAEGGAATALEVHSPSRVFARMGDQVTRGFAVGVERGTGHAAEAVVGMSDAAAGAAAPAVRAPAGAVATRTITFGDLHVHVANGSAEEARRGARALFEELAQLLEGSAIEMGAAT